MGRECNVYGVEERRIQGFGGEIRGKETTRENQTRWENIIKIDLQEDGCGGMDWTEVAQDRNICRHV